MSRARPFRTRLLASLLGLLCTGLATACSARVTATLPGPRPAVADAGAEGGVDTAGCALDASYTFGNDGGDVIYQDESILTAPNAYRHVRSEVRGADANARGPSCQPALPPCSEGSRVGLADILRDIADADVQAALAAASPPIYGFDGRPADGLVFRFERADGRGFFAGDDCDGGSFCYGVVPAGIARLEADLKALDLQELADPACAAFKRAP